jgi:hypothetical protein
MGVVAVAALKGDKPADLPAQAPTKYELVINLTSTCPQGLDSLGAKSQSYSDRDASPKRSVFHPTY